MVLLRPHMQEPNIPPLCQTISKAESPLSFLETKHPPGPFPITRVLSERGRDPSVAAGLVGLSLDRSLHPGGGMLYVRSCPCVIITSCTAAGDGPRGRPRAEEPSYKVYACYAAPGTLSPHTCPTFPRSLGKTRLRIMVTLYRGQT